MAISKTCSLCSSFELRLLCLLLSPFKHSLYKMPVLFVDMVVFPGHRRSPIFCGKRSHLIFAGLCILSRPVPGHRHFQDFGWRNCFSRRACLAVQSEHTIFAFLLDSIYFRRASYGNFRCPRSPHSSQRYGLMSLGDMPLLWHSLHTSLRLWYLAFTRVFASNAPSASFLWQASHVHCCLLFRHCIHTEESS